MNTTELRALLQRHYIKPGAPLPGGVYLPEVGWNNGSGGGGCDAIYVGFTSTSGRVLVGHELKVSRSDWLAELSKPGKADAWADQCHEWWLVVSDPSIVHKGELPAGWGLMSPGRSKTRMTVHVAAARKVDHDPSWLAVRSVMARQDTLRAKAITEARQAEARASAKTVEQRVRDEVARQDRVAVLDHDRLDQNAQRIAALERALGMKLQWDGEARLWGNQVTVAELAEVAEALRLTRSVKLAANQLTPGALGYQLRGVEQAVAGLRKALDAISAPSE